MFAFVITPILRLLHMILGVSTPQKFPPPLPPHEEALAFRQMRDRDKDGVVAREARQKLILHNLRLVSHIVRKYYGMSKNADDLISIGTIGLCKAIDTFHIDAGTKFATYAARCIQNEILMHFRAEKKHAMDISISETIDVDRDGNPLTYMDVISSEESVSDEVGLQVDAARAIHLINTSLEERERQVMVMRYGLGLPRPMTQREIAEKLGISRSYVSRIEKAAIEKLRDLMGGKG